MISTVFNVMPLILHLEHHVSVGKLFMHAVKKKDLRNILTNV